MAILILLTTLECTHATILASCRPYFAMAREATLGMSLMLTGVPMYWWFTKKSTKNGSSMQENSNCTERGMP